MIELPSWAIVTPRRTEHIARVTALIDGWAAARRLSAAEADRWHRAAVMHDALKDATPDVLARYAPRGDWHRKLWHGPAAAAAAARHGETDRGVLDAIRYHSIGFAGWDDVGKAVYLADYLEPEREGDRALNAARAARVPRELDAVVREVAGERIARLEAAGTEIGKETREFWNTLARDASSSS